MRILAIVALTLVFMELAAFVGLAWGVKAEQSTTWG